MAPSSRLQLLLRVAIQGQFPWHRFHDWTDFVRHKRPPKDGQDLPVDLQMVNPVLGKQVCCNSEQGLKVPPRQARFDMSCEGRGRGWCDKRVLRQGPGELDFGGRRRGASWAAER